LLTADDQGELPDKFQVETVSQTRCIGNELPSNACPPLFGRDDRFQYDRAVLSLAQCETDKRERRYSHNRHDVNALHVIVQPSRPPMFPSDAYEKRCVCRKEGDASDNGLPPGIERPQHADIAEEDQNQNTTLNESADLFPNESQQNTSTTGNEEAGSIPTVQSISSAWLHVSSATTGNPEEICSNREMTSLPCMASGSLSKGPAAVWTGDNSVEETAMTERICNEEIYEPLNKENRKSNWNKVKNANHIVNDLLVSAFDKKTSASKKDNTVFASVSTSPAMRVKCSKNEDYNAHFRPRTTDRQEKKPPFKERHDNRLTYQQYNSIIQQIPEIAYRCEKSVLKCEKTLQAMNKLLCNSRIENVWLRQHLQEMGFDFRRHERSTGVGTPPSKPAAAACMLKSGNTESTTLSTETARSQSSPPARACSPGLTSCQASRRKDKLGRQPSRIIRSHTVRETTPIARITAFMSTPVRSSFQSSTNSSFQNYARRLPAVRMARTKQTARKDRDERQCGRSHQPQRDRCRDRSNMPPRISRPRSPSRERLECVFCGQISFQRRNHRRHLITKHNGRPDGTPETAADIE